MVWVYARPIFCFEQMLLNQYEDHLWRLTIVKSKATDCGDGHSWHKSSTQGKARKLVLNKGVDLVFAVKIH